jgi:hypothetical protein
MILDVHSGRLHELLYPDATDRLALESGLAGVDCVAGSAAVVLWVLVFLTEAWTYELF